MFIIYPNEVIGSVCFGYKVEFGSNCLVSIKMVSDGLHVCFECFAFFFSFFFSFLLAEDAGAASDDFDSK